MAGKVRGQELDLKAASAIAQYVPVTPLPGGSALSQTVMRAGSVNDFPLGFTEATVPTYGMEVAVLTNGVMKGVAGGSLGAGALLGVGSTNGILVPLTPSGAASVANYPIRWSVGVALDNAAAGDIFQVWVKPDQVI